jgi:formate dehydrogenase subunit gamma
MSSSRRYFQRYPDGVRLNHWFVAMLFMLAGLSGIALFHPWFYPFTGLFGGGQWTRILHPYFGLLMVAGFVWLALHVWRENVWKPRDTAWVKKAHHLVAGNESAMPPVGKYNAGQKGMFWVFGVSLVLLFVTGFVFWQPWFAPYFSILSRRIAVVIHAAAAFALILSVIVHVYAGIWIKGSIAAMTRGQVSEDWARHHHEVWFQEMSAATGRQVPPDKA